MLEVKGLSVNYCSDDKVVNAVSEVSLAVVKGESLGVLGESGSGKSTIALSLMRLIYPPGKIVAGEILFNGQDMLKLSEEQMIKIRGAKISMVFQDPFTSLNPVFTVGDQIAEAIQLHQGLNRKEAWQKTIEMLDLVQIKDPGTRANNYPHQFSGGMCQRVMIAMALVCQPELLIADEPTTALDVTIQAEILKLLKEVQQKLNFGMVYITHNFGIIKHICDRVVVMKSGKVVERGEMRSVLADPQNEYTRRLIECLQILKI